MNTGHSKESGAIVSLEQVRARRQQKLREAEEQKREKERELFKLQQGVHRELMQRALVSRRMLFSDLADMIKLAVITDEEDLLPCRAHHRDTSYREWEDGYYGEDTEEPDEDLITELIQRLQSAGVERYEVERIIKSRKRKVPPANQVVCPLLCYDDDEDPPCAFALKNRVRSRFVNGELLSEALPYDAEDMVVRANLIPCVFLGRELIQSVMPGAWELEARLHAEAAPAAEDAAAAPQDHDDDEDDEDELDMAEDSENDPPPSA